MRVLTAALCVLPIVIPRRSRAALITFTVCLMAAPAAMAQVCSGGPSFSSGPVQTFVGVQATSGSQAVVGGVGIGSHSEGGPRAFVSVSGANVDGADSAPISIGGSFAYEIGAGDGRVFVCPGLGVSHTNGPDFLGLDVSVFEYGGGAQLGVVANRGADVNVVPTFGVNLRQGRATALGLSVFDTYGVANLGLGLIFNESMALTPAVSIPFGLPGGADAAFSLAFSVNFGS